MIKRLIKIVFIGGLLFSTGCSKTLEVKPVESVATQFFFNDQNDFDQALTGLYSSLRSTNITDNNGSLGGNLYWGVAADELFFQFSWHTPWFDVSAGTITPNTNDIGSMWEYGYKSIFWANTIIEKLEEKKDLLSEDFVKAANGEAHFIRAAVYLRLTSLYGAVPLVDKVISSPSEAKLPRTSVEEITTSVIVPDLDIAIANLKDVPYDNKFGKATKQAAIGMKTRALLYIKDYEGTVAAAQSLMDMAATSPNVAFLADFSGIFANNNENNPEILFSIKYTGNGTKQGATNNTPFGGYLPGVAGTNGGWAASAITPELIDAFPMIDGEEPANSPLYDPNNKWVNRGARFDYTFYVANKSSVNGQPFESWMVTAAGGSDYKTDYPLNLNKGFMNEDNKIDWTNEDESDFIVLRYTDVLMMYAEAKTELNQIDGTVYQILNMVRSRAGIAEVPTGLSQEEMRETIRKERRVEFAFEGLRYFDMRRWGISQEAIDEITSDEKYNFGSVKRFQSAQYLWPVPQTAIDANPNLLPNNSGY